MATVVLAVAAAPEAFLVLWATDRGVDARWVPPLWAAAHLAKTATTWRAGVATDRIGPVSALAIGWLARVAALAGLALLPASGPGVWALFVLYAVALARVEPAERALIAAESRPETRGTAIGLYHLLAGTGALPGAVAFGLVWQAAGAPVAFAVSAALSSVAAALLVVLGRSAPVARRAG